MVAVVQPAHVDKMRVLKPQFGRLFVHEPHEIILAARDVYRERAGCVGSRGERRAVHEVEHRHPLAGTEASTGGPRGVGVVQHRGVDVDGRAHVLDRFGGHEQSHDLGHGRGVYPPVGIALSDVKPGVEVDEQSVLGVKPRGVERCRLAVGAGDVAFDVGLGGNRP